MQRAIRFLKDWTLPVAITAGITFYMCFTRIGILQDAGNVLGTYIDRLFPFTVFLTLWTTFCKVDFRALRPANWSVPVTVTQCVSAAVFLMLALKTCGNTRLIMTGCLACVIAPCATASAVVTMKLGGNIHKMTAHTIFSSLLAAAVIPICATLLSPATGGWYALLHNGMHVLMRVASVLVLPLVLAWVVRHGIPSVHRWVTKHSNLPFYMWGITLAITMGVTVRGIDHAGLPFPILLVMAGSSLVICLAQFAVGRRIGVCYGNKIEAGQALGQKNTALTIWATAAFFHPAAALAPGCYVLWQNIVNSMQLHNSAHKKDKAAQQNAGKRQKERTL